MKIGLISDTHGFLDPRVEESFRGVSHILHAGDIGSQDILDALSVIAPVTAVLGNNDFDIDCKETAVVELGGVKFLVHHIVRPDLAARSIGSIYIRERPNIVVFGHTHYPYNSVHDGVRFLNPGYSGWPKSNQARSVAIVEVHPKGLHVRFDEW